MIGQYLLNINESAMMFILQIFLKLNETSKDPQVNLYQS